MAKRTAAKSEKKTSSQKSANQAKTKKTASQSTQTKSGIEIREEIVLAALTLAQDLGWDQVTLQDIASETGMNLSDLYGHCSDKLEILCHLGRMIDHKMLAAIGPADKSLPVRDRLFDVLMERFDVLNDHRDGIIAILNSFRLDPKQALISMPHLCRSMTWILEAAGVDTNGIKGAIKVAGLSALYLNVLRIWMSDDSPDLGKTMSALDKDLGRAEQAANSFGF